MVSSSLGSDRLQESGSLWRCTLRSLAGLVAFGVLVTISFFLAGAAEVPRSAAAQVEPDRAQPGSQTEPEPQTEPGSQPGQPGAGEGAGLGGVLGAVGWTRLDFEARKLLLKATTSLEVERIPVSDARSQLEEAPEPAGVAVALGTPALGTPALTLLTVRTDLPFGRDEVVTAWLDPTSGAALQAEKLVTGSKQYWKLWRFTDKGYYLWRSEPEDRSEAKLVQPSWSHRSQYAVSWDIDPGDLPVTDSYALLYLISAARLDREGASLSVGLIEKKRLVQVQMEAGKRRRLAVDLTLEWPGGSRRLDEEVMVREVRISGRLLSGAAADDEDVGLGFMGMHGEVHVALLEGSGIPVQVEGRTASFGSLTVRLRTARLDGAPSL